MDNSQAKAIVKRDYRVAEQRLNDLFKNPSFDMNKIRKPKGRFSDYLERIITLNNNFLLGHKKYQHKNKIYEIHELVGITPKFVEVKDKGLFSSFYFKFIDSKRHTRNQKKYITEYIGLFYFSEHFLIRAIQRFSLNKVAEAGELFFPVIHWLISKNISTKGMTKYIHILFDDYVVVVEKIEGQIGLLIKTILIRKHFDEKQSVFYSNGYSKQEDFSFVVIDEYGKVIHRVNNEFKSVFIYDNLKQSYWLVKVGTGESLGCPS